MEGPTFEEALELGRKAWADRGLDTTINVGKSVLTFHEGRLEMIQDDNGVIVIVPKGYVLVRKE